jgi:hypothetical protein
MSGQKMNPKRLVLVFVPFACVLFYALFAARMHRGIPHATTEGGQLSIATLVPEEEIVVQRLFSHRNTVAREYRIATSGTDKQVTVFSLSATHDGDRWQLQPEKLLAIHRLTNAEAEGLDETIAYFRKHREEDSSAERHYRLSYFRSGRKIGEEFFIGFSLPSELTYLWQQGYKNDPAYKHDYLKLADQYGVTREQIDKMVAFEMLEGERPNKAPEPTPTAVTPRAIKRNTK